MSKQADVPYFIQPSPLRGNFHRDNFRRLAWINLLLCCIILGQVGYIIFQYGLWVAPISQYYVSTTSGQLTLINGRLQ